VTSCEKTGGWRQTHGPLLNFSWVIFQL